MPAPTATRAATRSATSPPPRRCAFRRWRRSASACRGPLPGVPAPASPRAAFGRMAERSPGKDSVTGHWELMGLVLERPFPTFPHGFPAALIAAFEARIGRAGARQRRGLGHRDHRRARRRSTCAPAVRSSTPRPTACSRSPRTRTSCRSTQLYDWCRVAYDLAVEGAGTRPGDRPAVRRRAGRFTRTANRHDFAMPPPRETLLDRPDRGRRAGDRDRQDRRPVRRPRHHHVAPDHQRRRRPRPARGGAGDDGRRGLVFVNLVDFDTPLRASQRRRRLRRQPRALRPPARPRSSTRSAPDDLLVITADHGNDPATPSTDHSREYVPLLRAGAAAAAGRRPGHRGTFADRRPDAGRRGSASRRCRRHQPARRAALRPSAVPCDAAPPS